MPYGKKVVRPVVQPQSHGVFADLRDGVQASIANSLTLRGDGSQELNARPDQHRLRRIAPQQTPPYLETHRARWGELLIDLSVQLDSLPVADHQVVSTEACVVEQGLGLCQNTT